MQDISAFEGVFQVKENANGATVASLVTTDPDRGQSFVYKIVDNPAGPFTLDGNVLKVKQTGNIDYEIKSSYTVTIQSTDNGNPSGSFTKKIVVKIIDINEPPTSISLAHDKVACTLSLLISSYLRISTLDSRKQRYWYGCRRSSHQ